MDETTPAIDRIDRKILQALLEDGRISWRDLAERVGLSTTPVMRRVKALEERGFITGYAATLDEAQLAGSLSVFVQISLDKQHAGALVKFEEQIKLAPQVMSCFLMTGDFDYLLRVVTPSVQDFEVFLTNKLARIPGVAHLKSSFSLKSILVRQAPLV
ncbi:MAG TPA: Lrp/AsnC family transcriptional regulator [Variovorax sp.]|nr:Lrp/AsnC family transcriptional regulator [Variovorax sp.]